MAIENTSNNLLFVYGTLQIQGNYYADFLSKNACFISGAKLKGELFDLGNYPGAVHSSESKSYVLGSVFELENPDFVLRELDIYEGIGSQECEYTRQLVPIEAGTTHLICWVYLYILNSDGKFKIKDGDYLRYINGRSK
jgi:gamma-glutamylcyclotransferase (GGCT)/AIG2-like uncharacterized protein YtfP